jgi:hypothetical protein
LTKFKHPITVFSRNPLQIVQQRNAAPLGSSSAPLKPVALKPTTTQFKSRQSGIGVKGRRTGIVAPVSG